MNTLNRKTHLQVPALAGVLASALFGSLSASAAEPSAPEASNDDQYCRMETRRVAVWPHGPWKRVLQTPRYEIRTYFTCDDGNPELKTVRATSWGPRNR